MTDDPILKAAREARLARMSESYIGEVIFPSEALVRRYDAIRFKELHERVAELEGKFAGLKTDYNKVVYHKKRNEVKVDGLIDQLSAANEALKAERDALLKEREEAKKPCVWTEDSDGVWKSACGLVDWCFNDGGPEENKMKFCNGCAHPLIAEPYQDDCGHPVEVQP